MGGHRDDGERLIFEVYNNWTGGNRHKLQQEKFSLDVSEKVCTVRVVKHWSTWSRKVVDSLSTTS